MAIDAVPHEFSDEAADLLEAFGPIKLAHANGGFIAALFGNLLAILHVIGLTAARADARIGLHLGHQFLEIVRRHVQIEIHFRDIVEVIWIDGVIPGVEGVDHAAAQLAIAAIGAGEDADPGILVGVLLEDRRRLVLGAVVNDIQSVGRMLCRTMLSSVRRAYFDSSRQGVTSR